MAWAVQQLIFLAAASAPAAVLAFEGSWNLPAPQVTVLPPHFVVSAMQHVEASVAAQGAFAQFNVAASTFFFFPAAQAYVEHLALAVQQLVFMAAWLDPKKVGWTPAAVLAFEGSWSLPAPQVTVLGTFAWDRIYDKKVPPDPGRPQIGIFL